MASLLEGELSLERWSVIWKENGHLTEVVTNGARMVVLQVDCLMEEESHVRWSI